ncbi:MAG: hypothetical protein ACP5GU_09610 [Thermoprotei archaeon]
MKFEGLSKAKKLLIIIIIVLLVIGGLVVYQLLIPRTFFKGAYAVYYGKTSILFATINMTLRLEIVDINTTYAKILTYIKAETPLGVYEYQNTTWINLKNYTYNIEGSNLIRSYEDTIYIEKIGTRNVIVYEYRNKAGTETIYYIDKKTGWPIKIRYTSIFGQIIDLNLIDTNVPGLK